MKKISEKRKKRKGIQSIEIGFHIIKIMMETPHPLSLKDLSKNCKMTPSKIHSYLVSFINVGLVKQNEGTTFYCLGEYALKMGLTYINQFNILSVAQPIMNEIAEELEHTIFLGVWGNKGPCIIFRVDGRNSQAYLDLRIGSTLPLLTSALGLNFAAHIPSSIANPFIIKELQLSTVSKKFINIENVHKHLSKIKSNGYSFADGTLLSDFSAISVPIFDYSNNMIAGLTIMGISKIFKATPQKKTAEFMQKKAKLISQRMGAQIE